MGVELRCAGMEKSPGGSACGGWIVFTRQFPARDAATVCGLNDQSGLARGIELCCRGRCCFRGGDDSVLALRPGGFYAAARSSAQSRRVSNHPAICESGRAGVGRLHRDGSGVAEHQAPARDLAQRLCDRAGVPGRLRGHAYDNSDGNAFAHLDQLRSFLLVFWRARLWTEDVCWRRELADRFYEPSLTVGLVPRDTKLAARGVSSSC